MTDGLKKISGAGTVTETGDGSGWVKFEMAKEDQARLIDAVHISVDESAMQRAVTEFWTELGERYGFVPSTVRNPVHVTGGVPGSFEAQRDDALPLRDETAAIAWLEKQVGYQTLPGMTFNRGVVLDAWHAGRDSAIRDWGDGLITPARPSPDEGLIERAEAEEGGSAVAALHDLLEACTVEFGWYPDADPDKPVLDDPDCTLRWGVLHRAHHALAALPARIAPVDDGAIERALEKCRLQFLFYAQEHEAKASRFCDDHKYADMDASKRKGAINRQFVALCDAALSAAAPAVGADDNPPFDVTKPPSLDRDAALAELVLQRYRMGHPFTKGDAARVVDVSERLRRVTAATIGGADFFVIEHVKLTPDGPVLIRQPFANYPGWALPLLEGHAWTIVPDESPASDGDRR